MRVARPLPLAAAIILFGARPVFAATEIKLENVQLGSGHTTEQTMIIAPQGFKLDGPAFAMIYRPDESKSYMIDKKRRTYIEPGAGMPFNPASDPRLQQRLAQLPEAQRKAAEQAMGQHGAEAAPGSEEAEPVKLEKIGTKTVGNWQCDVFRRTVGTEHETDLCIAPVGKLGITAEDIATFKKFSEGMRNRMHGPMAARAASVDFDAITKAIGYQGFPVETVIYSDDKPVARTTVKSIEHADVPPTTFEPPPDYQKQDIGSMMHHGAPPAGGDHP